MVVACAVTATTAASPQRPASQCLGRSGRVTGGSAFPGFGVKNWWQHLVARNSCLCRTQNQKYHAAESPLAACRSPDMAHGDHAGHPQETENIPAPSHERAPKKKAKKRRVTLETSRNIKIRVRERRETRQEGSGGAHLAHQHRHAAGVDERIIPHARGSVRKSDQKILHPFLTGPPRDPLKALRHVAGAFSHLQPVLQGLQVGSNSLERRADY